jgi:DHA1 family multidrug resistance protein-like MFS transporter
MPPRIRPPRRVSAWLDRWGPLLPLLVTELIVYVGFGALLPVLPLYVQEQGISATELGLIVAAWPIAKLLSEPIAGWWADRHPRKPQMVAGLVILGIASLLPLYFASFLALFVLRFIAGAATGLFDPAARGMIVDATEDDERGEAFGFYAAFQIGGFAIGPAIGALGAALIGGYAFPFFFTFALALAAAVVLAVYLPARPHVVEGPQFEHHPDARPLPGVPFTASEVAAVPAPRSRTMEQAPVSAIFNRTVMAALVLTFGLHLSFGTYEVIWSIYLVALGASIAWVGATFVLFAIPEMVAAPIAGRLIDRRGPIGFIVGSSLVIMVSGALYALATEPVLPTIVVPVEAAATAVMNPALYTLLARGTPVGRSSTAQGLFGAVSTAALVVASVVAGALFERDTALPFWFFVVGMGVCFVVGLAIYRSARPSASAAPAGSPAVQ